MAYAQIDITEFMMYFHGNETAHGQTKITGTNTETGKAEAQCRLVYETPTPAVFNRHLQGQESIGIAPIMEDGTCFFGAIDIDSYDYSLIDIVEAIEDFNLPIVPCWSKSKKLHLYILFSEPTPAADVQRICAWYSMAFACKDKTEIFPKQAHTTENATFYSWINLPYFDAENPNNHRKMVGKRGYLYTLAEALGKMGLRRKTLKQHEEFISELPYHDAPPCILTGTLLRDIGPGQRNTWLFSAGVYLRMKDETVDLETELSELNQSLHEPIPQVELDTTILKGFQRKTYFYKCAELSRCNKRCCRKQQYGIDSAASTGLDYGDMTQVMTDPPYYEWIVNGQKLTFYNENEILMQNKFRALCMRQLHLVPRHAKDDVWSAILTRALEHVKVVEPVILEGDFSSGSILMDAIYDFFTARRKADNITQISMGRVYEDSRRQEYVFTAHAIMDYVQNTRNIHTTGMEIRHRIVGVGAYKDNNTWRLAIEAVPASLRNKQPVSITFKRDEEDDETKF